MLALNFGAVLALLVPVLGTWWSLRSAVVPVFYGPISWVFTIFGVGVFATECHSGGKTPQAA